MDIAVVVGAHLAQGIWGVVNAGRRGAEVAFMVAALMSARQYYRSASVQTRNEFLERLVADGSVGDRSFLYLTDGTITAEKPGTQDLRDALTEPAREVVSSVLANAKQRVPLGIHENTVVDVDSIFSHVFDIGQNNPADLAPLLSIVKSGTFTAGMTNLQLALNRALPFSKISDRRFSGLQQIEALFAYLNVFLDRPLIEKRSTVRGILGPRAQETNAMFALRQTAVVDMLGRVEDAVNAEKGRNTLTETQVFEGTSLQVKRNWVEVIKALQTITPTANIQSLVQLIERCTTLVEGISQLPVNDAIKGRMILMTMARFADGVGVVYRDDYRDAIDAFGLDRSAGDFDPTDVHVNNEDKLKAYAQWKHSVDGFIRSVYAMINPDRASSSGYAPILVQQPDGKSDMKQLADCVASSSVHYTWKPLCIAPVDRAPVNSSLRLLQRDSTSTTVRLPGADMAQAQRIAKALEVTGVMGTFTVLVKVALDSANHITKEYAQLIARNETSLQTLPELLLSDPVIRAALSTRFMDPYVLAKCAESVQQAYDPSYTRTDAQQAALISSMDTCIVMIKTYTRAAVLSRSPDGTDYQSPWYVEARRDRSWWPLLIEKLLPGTWAENWLSGADADVAQLHAFDTELARRGENFVEYARSRFHELVGTVFYHVFRGLQKQEIQMKQTLPLGILDLTQWMQKDITGDRYVAMETATRSLVKAGNERLAETARVFADSLSNLQKGWKESSLQKGWKESSPQSLLDALDVIEFNSNAAYAKVATLVGFREVGHSFNMDAIARLKGLQGKGLLGENGLEIVKIVDGYSANNRMYPPVKHAVFHPDIPSGTETHHFIQDFFSWFGPKDPPPVYTIVNWYNLVNVTAAGTGHGRQLMLAFADFMSYLDAEAARMFCQLPQEVQVALFNVVPSKELRLAGFFDFVVSSLVYKHDKSWASWLAVASSNPRTRDQSLNGFTGVVYSAFSKMNPWSEEGFQGMLGSMRVAMLGLVEAAGAAMIIDPYQYRVFKWSIWAMGTIMQWGGMFNFILGLSSAATVLRFSPPVILWVFQGMKTWACPRRRIAVRNEGEGRAAPRRAETKQNKGKASMQPPPPPPQSRRELAGDLTGLGRGLEFPEAAYSPTFFRRFFHMLWPVPGYLFPTDEEKSKAALMRYMMMSLM